MSLVDELLARSQQHRRQLTTPQPNNPFAAQPGYLGGFIESGLSSIPEFIGGDPTPGAVQFRAANPISGFVSQVLPTMVPYVGAYKLSQTARGAAALSKGMAGVKAVGKAAGLNVVDRPVIASAVKEMLRYSPVELGRLGVGMAINPDNTGDLFADVALSTAFAGAFGGIGGYLKVGGTAKRALGGRVAGQDNMFAHPVVDLRAARMPEATTVAGEGGEALQREIANLTADVLNDKPMKGYLSKQDIPIIHSIENGDDKLAQHINAQLAKPNGAAVKERALDRRKLWEGPVDNATTLNPGELQPLVQELGFQDASELAENVLQARVVSMNKDSVAGTFNKMLESPGVVKYGEGVFAARTNTGSTVLFKRLGQKAGNIANQADNPTLLDDAVAAQQPDITASNLDDAFWSQGEINLWHQGKAPQDAIDKVRNGFVYQGGDMVPATDDVLKSITDDAAKEINFYNKRIQQIEAAPEGKLIAPFSDGTPLSKMEAAQYVRSSIAREQATIEKATRQNARWKAAGSPLTLESKPVKQFQAGDRWAVIHTDRPGAFVRDLEKLNATNKQIWSTMRRVFQETKVPHLFNQADDILLRTVSPMDVARLSRQSRKTWVAETAAALKNRTLQTAGLEGNHALQNYADHLYDIFSPSMFKERRNSLFARYSGIMQNRLRVVNEKVNEAIFGKEGLKAGTKGTMGRNFERQQINGEMSFREATAQLNDEELDLVIKALITQTPAKDVAKLAADGKISETAFKAVERMQAINANFMNDVVLPATKSIGEKGNFDLLEGYVIPRILLGDWRIPVTTEKGGLVYLASGKTRGAAERMAKAIVDEAAERGSVWKADAASLKHAVEQTTEDVTDIMADVGRKLDEDPAAVEIVQSAMKRVQFLNVQRAAHLPYRPRSPGSLTNARSGIKATDTTYTREEFIKAFEAHIRKMGNFAAIQSYMERWGNEVMVLKGQNAVLYNDLMRRAQQALGVEGQITRTLNNVLTPVLGANMGSKAATKIAAATNKTLYAWQLGFANPTFALLNAISPLQTVLPQLAFVMRAPTMEANKLLHHIPLLNAEGKPIGQGAFLDPIKLMWNAVRQLRHADEELQHIHVRLRNDNTLHPMLFEEHVGAGATNPQSLKESFQSGGWAQFLVDGSTVMARKSEEFARIVSANSGYLVGKHHLGLEGEQLYHFTRRFIESTNYLYGQSDRARLITGPVGSMFGLFKNWQMHFMGMMAVYAGLGIKHNVWSPMVWQMAAASTLGGLGATPLKNLADGLTHWATGDDTKSGFLWMQENWGRPWADMAFFGPMGGLGVSLQASSSLPGTDVRNDLQMLTNSVVIERAKSLGGAIGAAWQANTAGINPLTDPNVRDQLIAAAAPRAISRAASVAEGNYIKSMGTGYPQIQNPSFTAKMLHGMGMNSVEIERHQVVSKQLYNDQVARKLDTTNHGKAYAAAVQYGDYDEAQRIMLSATARHLDLSSVMQSASNYQRRESGDLLSRYSLQQTAQARAILGE